MEFKWAIKSMKYMKKLIKQDLIEYGSYTYFDGDPIEGKNKIRYEKIVNGLKQELKELTAELSAIEKIEEESK